MDKKISLKTPFAEVFLSSDWSSSAPKYRDEIRIELYKKSRDKNVLDLEKLPTFKDFFVSISHCKSLGGYALNLKEKIGFDVEEAERLTGQNVERISSEAERSLLNESSYKYLWCIKEATFKCLQGEVDMITEAQVIEFQKINEQSFQGVVKAKDKSLNFLCGLVGKNCIFAIVK